MTLPLYPAYKDSGVEWLGEVPEHWEVGPLKRMVSIQNGADYKDVQVDDGYPVIGSGGVFSFASDFLYDGESVLFGRKGTIDKPLYVTGRFWTVDTMYWSKILPGTNGRFCYYVALTVPYGYYATSTALPSITKLDLNSHKVPIAPLLEQVSIASFLDHETSKIDALIAEQQKLIALLKEKRQAVISHAVTQGLNPDVPMKDSGVEWLGEVPAHWKVTRLKFATSLIVDCPHETPIYSEDGDYLVVRTADIDRGRVDRSAMYRVDAPEYRIRVRRQELLESDVVYGREGERWGHAALVPESYRFCLGQRMMQFRPGGHFYPKFLMWQLNSDAVYRQGEVETVGATSPHVNVATIRNFVLIAPPFGEQVEIGAFLRSEVEQFDRSILEAARSVELLQERRSALISAAVTGKIDVRGLVRQEAA